MEIKNGKSYFRLNFSVLEQNSLFVLSKAAKRFYVTPRVYRLFAENRM